MLATRGGSRTRVCTTIATGVWVRQTVLVCITHGLNHRWRHEDAAPSRYNHGVQPRDVTTVSVLWSAPSSSRYRGLKPWCEVQPLGSTPWCQPRGFSRLTWFAQPTLLSLLWYKPGVRLPPRVAIVVSIQRIRSLIVRGATKPCANPAPSCGFDWVS